MLVKKLAPKCGPETASSGIAGLNCNWC